MAGQMYDVHFSRQSGASIGHSDYEIVNLNPTESPLAYLATITDYTHITLGDPIGELGRTRDGIDQFDYSVIKPENLGEYGGYNITNSGDVILLIKQKLKFGYNVSCVDPLLLKFDKLDILGFANESDSPNYNLVGSVVFENQSFRVECYVMDNVIYIESNTAFTGGESAYFTLDIVCKLKLTEEDYQTAFSQNMSVQYNQWGMAHGYVFYDSVLAQDGFTVTFDANGGTPEPEPITGVESGSTIEPPEFPPYKEHYTFDGWYWYPEPEVIHLWDFNEDVVTEDITLHAEYKIDTYTVTFNSEGGTQVSPYTSVEYGSTILEPSTPEKLEKDFGGWYKDEEYENEWDFENDVVTDDITLYAKWIDWSTSRISNPNVFSGMPLTLVRGRKVRREFRPFR